MQEASFDHGERNMTISILPERPDTPDAQMLIAELEAHLEPYYPKTSRHGYSVEKLLQQNVAFFCDAPRWAPGRMRRCSILR